MIHTRPAFTMIPSLLAVAGLASGQATWTVDDDGGTGIDFTTIQAALNVAQPADRIDVRAGFYGPFTIERGVTLMGEPGVVAGGLGAVKIEGVPAGETVVVTDLDLFGVTPLEVLNSSGPVILDSINARSVRVSHGDDVRIRALECQNLLLDGSFVQATSCVVASRGSATDSTITLSDCTVRGQVGETGCSVGGSLVNPFPPSDGRAALTLRGSVAHLMDCTLIGGAGGIDSCFPGLDGAGAPGLVAEDGSTVFEGRSQILAGFGGPGSSGPVALDASSTLEVSGDLPAMGLDGGSAVGDTALFRCRAGAGTSVRLYAGRRAIQIPFGPVSLPILHSSERPISLGSFGTSGERMIPFTIPALSRGTLVFAQIRRTRADGETRNSNAAVLVVR